MNFLLYCITDVISYPKILQNRNVFNRSGETLIFGPTGNQKVAQSSCCKLVQVSYLKAGFYLLKYVCSKYQTDLNQL